MSQMRRKPFFNDKGQIVGYHLVDKTEGELETDAHVKQMSLVEKLIRFLVKHNKKAEPKDDEK